MKFIRTLLIAVFLLSLIASPASAQGGALGYVVLVSQANPGLPLVLQARQAFDRLAPALLAAQHSGAVISFTPELEAGLLKIKFAPGGQNAMPAGLSVYSNLNQAARLVPHLRNQTTRTANQAPIFQMQMNSSCFWVDGLSYDWTVLGSLRDKTGRILSVFKGNADASGFLPGCFDWLSAYNGVLPGYKITFKLLDSFGVPQGTYNSVTPAYSINSINKTAASATGSAPAGLSYNLTWYHTNLDADNTLNTNMLTSAVAPSSQWSHDFGQQPFRGGDLLWMNLHAAGGFHYGVSSTVPFSGCSLGGDSCFIYGLPFKPASLTITHAGVPYTFSGKFDRRGWFSASLADADDTPILLVAGDSLVGTGIARWKLPTITTALDYSRDRITGKGPANRHDYISISQASAYSWLWDWYSAGADGKFSVDVSSSFDLLPDSAYVLRVESTDPLTGNLTIVRPIFTP
jgi:hypothetical protein